MSAGLSGGVGGNVHVSAAILAQVVVWVGMCMSFREKILQHKGGVLGSVSTRV